MPPTDVLTIVGAGLASFLMIGVWVTDRQVKRLEREIAADEAAREASRQAAE